MEAWNAFYQTTLYFRPDDAYYLFCYQKLITNLATQFKFKAVYSYDINFRNLMARESVLDKGRKSGKWKRRHEELACIHLTQDNRLPPTKCFNCNGGGHVATNCPEPKQRERLRSRSRSRSPQRKTSRNNRNNRNRSPAPSGKDNQTSSSFRIAFPGNCDHYNLPGEGCKRGPTCRFPHKCQACDGRHPSFSSRCQVGSNTSTGFRPRR